MLAKELIVDATIQSFETVQNFVEECLELLDASMKTQMQVSIALEEIFINIVHYAYPGEVGKARVRVESFDDPPRVVVTISDKGMPYNPLEREDPDITLGVRERPIGGLGIFMTKKFMDEVYYDNVDGKNIFTMVKYL